MLVIGPELLNDRRYVRALDVLDLFLTLFRYLKTSHVVLRAASNYLILWMSARARTEPTTSYLVGFHASTYSALNVSQD
jgi:hypothetical protein